jgi:hypothetical protein
MTFDEILSQVQDLLRREQRVSYRGLKRRFALDDEYIEDLKEELIGRESKSEPPAPDIQKPPHCILW